MQDNDKAPPASDEDLTDENIDYMLMRDVPDDEAAPSILTNTEASDDEPTIEQIEWALGGGQKLGNSVRPRPSLISPQMERLLDGDGGSTSIPPARPAKAAPAPPKPTTEAELLAEVDRAIRTLEAARQHFQAHRPNVAAPAHPALAERQATKPAGAPPAASAVTPQPAPRPVTAAKPSQALVVRRKNPQMDLGTFDSQIAHLREQVRKRFTFITTKLKQGDIDVITARDLALMDLDEYLYTVKNFKAMRSDLLSQRAAGLPVDHPDYAPHVPMFSFKGPDAPFVMSPLNPLHTPDAEGWINYLKGKFPAAVEQTLKTPKIRALFPEAGRQEHTLILGPSRWGKSELMKALLHHYATDGSAAVVVLDPGGDLVKQVSKWPELVRENRLRLIQPGLDRGFEGVTVGFNPLDGTGLDLEQRRIVAADWAYTLGMIGSHKQDLTPSMTLLVTMCVQVLLSVPGATLDDLSYILMLRPKVSSKEVRPEAPHPRAAELQKLARNYAVRRVAEFFRYQYDTDSVEGTREALRRRIETVMNYPHAEAMLTGEATLNLEEEIEARRFVLVDLSRFGKVGGAAIGRLFVAQVAAIGRRRECLNQQQRTPTHLFIDESSTMVSASMFEVIKELRKFGIFMTLGQQVGGDEMTPEQRAILKISTGCKLIAPSSVVEDWIDIPADEGVPELNRHEFAVVWAGVPGVHKLQVRSDLADQTHAIEPWEWRRHLEEITDYGGYYRSAVLAQAEPFEDVPASPPLQRQRGRRADLPDGVTPELEDKFVSKTGREGDW